MLLHSKKYLSRGQVHSLREAMILLSLLLNALKTLFRVEIQNFMMESQEMHVFIIFGTKWLQSFLLTWVIY